MSHFAKVNNGIVETVIVADDDFFETFVDSSPGTWIKTSYNTHGCVHYGADGKPDGGIALRGNFAGIGHKYDAVNDVFYSPQPFSSWVLSEKTWMWSAPKPIPTDGKSYTWDNNKNKWVVVK
jgi:hypothetical protein